VIGGASLLTQVGDRQHCTRYPPTLHTSVALSPSHGLPETDVDDRFYYGANCSSCLHASRLSLTKSRAHLGDDYLVAQIRHRLKCELCGSKAVTITYLTPEQCTGSLVDVPGICRTS
jgi:hypothetical protein